MSAPRNQKTWAVIVKKSSGVDVFFSVHETQVEADAASGRLCGFGLTARVLSVAAPGAVPGTTLHSPGEQV